MIISFAHTTKALLAGEKTCTRRNWAEKHAAKFKAGMLVDAWNTTPRNVRGNPHKVAVIRLTHDPYQEMSNLVENGGRYGDDYAAEGFAYLDSLGQQGLVDGILLDWETRPRLLWVVRFELAEVVQ